MVHRRSAKQPPNQVQSKRQTPLQQVKPPRLISTSGKINVVQIGASHSRWSDLYHGLLKMSWLEFLGLMLVSYLLLNALFALLYLTDPAPQGGIANAQPHSFLDAFFFSVQTLASIGYGAMHPQTVYTNIIVTIEALLGLFWLTTSTGLVFARFSRPTAKVLFSRVAVVTAWNGVPTLMLRAANQRGNQILEAQIRMTLVQNEVTAEGETMRRFYDMPLLRSQSPVFALTWTAMHPIGAQSPLYNLSADDLVEANAEILVTLMGVDDTFSQTIYARHSYLPGEIMWNSRFADILTYTPEGKRAIDYTQFHNVISQR